MTYFILNKISKKKKKTIDNIKIGEKNNWRIGTHTHTHTHTERERDTEALFCHSVQTHHTIYPLSFVHSSPVLHHIRDTYTFLRPTLGVSLGRTNRRFYQPWAGQRLRYSTSRKSARCSGFRPQKGSTRTMRTGSC